MTLAVGIPGVNMASVQREIPADEPPPLPANAQLSVIGKRTSRLDARLKATGAARYTSDVRLPGMLYGHMLRSPHPHARDRSIDTSAAERYPGVRAVHILDTVVGGATERDPEHPQPQVNQTGTGRPPVIRFAGQPIAAVAATTPDAAADALWLIRVDYEPLPFVADMEEAQKPNAPLVFSGPIEQEGTGGGGGAHSFRHPDSHDEHQRRTPCPFAICSPGISQSVVNEVLPSNRLLTRANELAEQLLKTPSLTRRYTRLIVTKRMKRLINENVPFDMGLEGASITASGNPDNQQ